MDLCYNLKFNDLCSIRIYEPKKENRPLGKLPYLTEQAKSFRSKIQKYVDFVLGVPLFSSEKDDATKELEARHGWTSKFDKLDNHLTKAQDNAKTWYGDVSLTIALK